MQKINFHELTKFQLRIAEEIMKTEKRNLTYSEYLVLKNLSKI